LKCHQSKAQFNQDLIPIKVTPYRHPSKGLYVIGITGTNGKTSVSYLIGEVLKSAGYKPFVLGTLNSENKDLSTPEPADIEKFMRDHLEQGGTHFIMEVPSEGINQARMLGIDFNIKLLTNITQDHLDYHKTFANYQQTKLSFMREGNAHKINPQDFRNEPINFTTKLLGHFNLLNIKAATSILRHINISETVIQKNLSSCSPPRGCNVYPN
jgi:UDP-N-acetylmuramoyl-L-alanyl-D-glutamate--2,6-diaminopimelate ligase